jgi:hypothetical protein
LELRDGRSEHDAQAPMWDPLLWIREPRAGSVCFESSIFYTKHTLLPATSL